MKVTLFKNAFDKQGIEKEFPEILSEFSKYKKDIDTIRAITEPDPETLYKKRNEIKQKLPLFCMARYRQTTNEKGELERRKRDKNLIEVTGAQIDLDHIDEFYIRLFQTRFEREYYCVFHSPSGDGLKVLVKYDKPVSLEEHEKIWDYLAERFSKITNLPIERNAPSKVCPDVRPGGKPCFISFYPSIFVKPEHVFNTREFLDSLPKETTSPAPVKKSNQIENKTEPTPVPDVKKVKADTTAPEAVKSNQSPLHWSNLFTDAIVEDMRKKELEFSVITVYFMLLLYYKTLTYEYVETGKKKKKYKKKAIEIENPVIQVGQGIIAERLNLSQGHVSDCIRTLIAKGYIELVKRNLYKHKLTNVYKPSDRYKNLNS